MISAEWLSRWGEESLRRMAIVPVMMATTTVTGMGVVALVSDPGSGWGWLLGVPSVLAAVSGVSAVSFVKSGKDLVGRERREFDRGRNAHAKVLAKQYAGEVKSAQKHARQLEKERRQRVNEQVNRLHQNRGLSYGAVCDIEAETARAQIGWCDAQDENSPGDSLWLVSY